MIEIMLYLLTGVFAGLLAGLLGVGGGLVVVPVLSLLFTPYFPAPLVMHVAVGTSFAIMIFTALSSAYAYHRRRLIFWPLFLRFVPGLLAGTVAGSVIARELSSQHLRFAFAIFIIFVAINMFFSKEVKSRRQLPNLFVLSFFAFLVGILSGFFGIGGGTMMVPFFVYCDIEMHKATGTSAACGFPLAVIGTLSMTITGWTTAIANHAPIGTIGYIYWPAAIIIAISSLLCAPLGTRLAVWLPSRILKCIFAVVLTLTAVNLLLK